MGDGGLDLTVGSQSISMVLLLRLTVIFFAAIHRALGAPLITSSIPHTAQVLLPYGQLIGNRLELVDEYLGVPYAKPPTRFEPPQAWSSPYPNGTWKASEYSDICLQVVRDPNDVLHPTASVHGSEDCLHLNVYTPRHGRKPMPVMLWIHGGDLTQGSAMNPLFNGSHLAASQRVVVVAINYRLNALGFLAIQRDDGTTSSNNGLRDQQEAMRFVKRNIAAFGGQPNNVTIFGESAGGLSVGVHLVSPSSANLFAAAISQSGDITNNAPLSLALNDTATLVERFSCARNAFSCLKTVNVSQLVAAFMTLPHARGSVVIDGDVLPAAVVEMVELKQFNKVPYILGNNADEASLFMNITSYTAAGASCVIQKGFGAVKALEILSLYPLVEGTDNRQALVDLMSDIMYHCENRRFALALAEAGHAGHMYSFKRHSGAAG